MGTARHAGRERCSAKRGVSCALPLAHLANAIASVVGLDPGCGRVQRAALICQHALQHGVHLRAHARWQGRIAPAAVAALLLALLLLLLLLWLLVWSRTTGGRGSCRPRVAAVVPAALLLAGLHARRAQRHGEPSPALHVELVELVEQLRVEAVALQARPGKVSSTGGTLSLVWEGW